MNVSGKVQGLILLVVGIIVIFSIIGATATDLQLAAGNVSTTTLPLSSLFSPTGVIMMVFMAGILISIVRVAMARGNR